MSQRIDCVALRYSISTKFNSFASHKTFIPSTWLIANIGKHWNCFFFRTVNVVGGNLQLVLTKSFLVCEAKSSGLTDDVVYTCSFCLAHVDASELNLDVVRGENQLDCLIEFHFSCHGSFLRNYSQSLGAVNRKGRRHPHVHLHKLALFLCSRFSETWHVRRFKQQEHLCSILVIDYLGQSYNIVFTFSVSLLHFSTFRSTWARFSLLPLCRDTEASAT